MFMEILINFHHRCREKMLKSSELASALTGHSQSVCMSGQLEPRLSLSNVAVNVPAVVCKSSMSKGNWSAPLPSSAKSSSGVAMVSARDQRYVGKSSRKKSSHSNNGGTIKGLKELFQRSFGMMQPQQSEKKKLSSSGMPYLGTLFKHPEAKGLPGKRRHKSMNFGLESSNCLLSPPSTPYNYFHMDQEHFQRQQQQHQERSDNDSGLVSFGLGQELASDRSKTGSVITDQVTTGLSRSFGYLYEADKTPETQRLDPHRSDHERIIYSEAASSQGDDVSSSGNSSHRG
ncbi:hypothetical protein Ciccas_007595 [Cichlidogyrus casuarinus]|uniref:Uncharacterized protein n=1 Tax=Cichlidogyrus casuarinus TaxID=1844966 RepID=A0ABD2Q2H7_9PLAT